MPAGSSHPTHNADSTNVKMFAEQLLVAHNRLRHQHGAPSLTLSEELTEQAQQWAEKLAKRRHLAYCELPGIGENITFFPIDIGAETVAEHWYDENTKYEYETPGWQCGTNYFTQLVWKATQEMGVGVAFIYADDETTQEERTPLEKVIVVFYRPAGNNNRAGQFAANVEKPTAIAPSDCR